MQTSTDRETYIKACNLLRLHPGKVLEWNKDAARHMLDTFAPDAPLRLKAAATAILRATRGSILPR